MAGNFLQGMQRAFGPTGESAEAFLTKLLQMLSPEAPEMESVGKSPGEASAVQRIRDAINLGGSMALEGGMGPAKQIPAVLRSHKLRSVLDELLGFSRDLSRQMPHGEQAYKTGVKVRVSFDDGTKIVDEVKGLTPKHALEAAHRNWPGAQIEPLEIISTKKQ